MYLSSSTEMTVDNDDDADDDGGKLFLSPAPRG